MNLNADYCVQWYLQMSSNQISMLSMLDYGLVIGNEDFLGSFLHDGLYCEHGSRGTEFH